MTQPRQSLSFFALRIAFWAVLIGLPAYGAVEVITTQVPLEEATYVHRGGVTTWQPPDHRCGVHIGCIAGYLTLFGCITAATIAMISAVTSEFFLKECNYP